MLLCIVFLTMLSTSLLNVEGLKASSLSKGLERIGRNIRSFGDPQRMLKAGSAISSVYVGATGIYMRSGVIGSINQLEQGKKEDAMETLNVAIASMAVFDLTQSTVSPIASELIHQLVKHKGHFAQTLQGFSSYNNALKTQVLTESIDDAGDIIGRLTAAKKRIAQYFDNEVKTFFQGTELYDSLVKSLQGAKKWAKALTWADTISGPLFDAANVAFSSWQLHEAIHDTVSSKEERALNIANSSLGVASGTVGLVSFVVSALAIAGSTLAAVAGPIGAIIGCILGVAAIIIDLVNSVNPHTKIKHHLETIQALKEGSLQYLENHVNLTQAMTSSINRDVGFDTVYQVNQGNLITGVFGEKGKSVRGVDTDLFLDFKSKNFPGQENGYLTMGQNRDFDKSKYANSVWRPSGSVKLGYDFYGKRVNSEGIGTSVFATTPMLTDNFYIRSVHIDTRLDNDQEAPDNVIIGEMTNLELSGNTFYIFTGAGDDLVQIAGLVCNQWDVPCLNVYLGTGVNTLSFQGMNYDRLEFPRNGRHQPYTLTAMEIDLNFERQTTSVKYILRVPEDPKRRVVYEIGKIENVDVLHGSPFDDEIWLSDIKDQIVKSDNGTNKYVIRIFTKRDFTHTIIDNSDHFGSIYLASKRLGQEKYQSIHESDVVYNSETQTLVIYVRDSNDRHVYTGRIIFKRTKAGDIGQMHRYLASTQNTHRSCEVHGLKKDGLYCSHPTRLSEERNEMGTDQRMARPVPNIPFRYCTDVAGDFNADPIPGLCGDFMLILSRKHRVIPFETTSKYTLTLPQNSLLIIDDEYISEWSTEEKMRYSPFSAFYYERSHKKLFSESRNTRLGWRHDRLAQVRGTIELSVPQANGIVFGTAEATNFYLISNMTTGMALLESEYLALASRPRYAFNFTEDHIDESDKPKQVVLGIPYRSAITKQVTITLGKATTAYGEYAHSIGQKATGDYAENALIVNNILQEYLTREGDTMEIKFRRDKTQENTWKM
uniref:Toxin n=1 Tax=Actineria villosa TaxID=227975 RepID=E9RGH6_ACTVL|nr:toxin [Actineria villosa]